MPIDPTCQTSSFNKRITFKKPVVYLIVLLACLGFLLSVTQILGESPDYDNYVIFFDLLRSEGLEALYSYRFEPGFTIVAFALISLFDSSLLVFSIFVAVLMLMKGWVIDLFSSTRSVFFVVAVFYFVRYFSLYELTQLRAAFATGFLMFAAAFLWRGKRFYGLLACVASILFHMSAVAVIPVLFIQSTKRLIVILVGIGIYILVLSGSSFIVNFLPNYITVFSDYQQTGFGDIAVNRLAPTLLLDWLMIAVSLMLWNNLSSLMKQIVLLEIIGMAIFYGATDFPVVAHRIREFYSVFWVFFVADGLHREFVNIPIAGFVLASIGLYSYLFVFSGNFFH